MTFALGGGLAIVLFIRVPCRLAGQFRPGISAPRCSLAWEVHAAGAHGIPWPPCSEHVCAHVRWAASWATGMRRPVWALAPRCGLAMVVPVGTTPHRVSLTGSIHGADRCGTGWTDSSPARPGSRICATLTPCRSPCEHTGKAEESAAGFAYTLPVCIRRIGAWAAPKEQRPSQGRPLPWGSVPPAWLSRLPGWCSTLLLHLRPGADQECGGVTQPRCRSPALAGRRNFLRTASSSLHGVIGLT